MSEGEADSTNTLAAAVRTCNLSRPRVVVSGEVMAEVAPLAMAIAGGVGSQSISVVQRLSRELHRLAEVGTQNEQDNKGRAHSVVSLLRTSWDLDMQR